MLQELNRVDRNDEPGSRKLILNILKVVAFLVVAALLKILFGLETISIEVDPSMFYGP